MVSASEAGAWTGQNIFRPMWDYGVNTMGSNLAPLQNMGAGMMNFGSGLFGGPNIVPYWGNSTPYGQFVSGMIGAPQQGQVPQGQIPQGQVPQMTPFTNFPAPLWIDPTQSQPLTQGQQPSNGGSGRTQAPNVPSMTPQQANSQLPSPVSLTPEGGQMSAAPQGQNPLSVASMATNGFNPAHLGYILSMAGQLLAGDNPVLQQMAGLGQMISQGAQYANAARDIGAGMDFSKVDTAFLSPEQNQALFAQGQTQEQSARQDESLDLQKNLGYGNLGVDLGRLRLQEKLGGEELLSSELQRYINMMGGPAQPNQMGLGKTYPMFSDNPFYYQYPQSYWDNRTNEAAAGLGKQTNLSTQEALDTMGATMAHRQWWDIKNNPNLTPEERKAAEAEWERTQTGLGLEGTPYNVQALKASPEEFANLLYTAQVWANPVLNSMMSSYLAGTPTGDALQAQGQPQLR